MSQSNNSLQPKYHAGYPKRFKEGVDIDRYEKLAFLVFGQKKWKEMITGPIDCSLLDDDQLAIAEVLFEKLETYDPDAQGQSTSNDAEMQEKR